MPSYLRKTLPLPNEMGEIKGICENIRASNPLSSAVVLIDIDASGDGIACGTILDHVDPSKIGEHVEGKVLAIKSCYAEMPVAVLKGARFQNKLTINPKNNHYDVKTLRCQNIDFRLKDKLGRGLNGTSCVACVESLEDFSAQIETGDAFELPVRHLLFAKGEVWSLLYDAEMS